MPAAMITGMAASPNSIETLPLRGLSARPIRPMKAAIQLDMARTPSSSGLSLWALVVLILIRRDAIDVARAVEHRLRQRVGRTQDVADRRRVVISDIDDDQAVGRIDRLVRELAEILAVREAGQTDRCC